MRWHMRLVALYKCWTFTCCLLHAEVHTRRRHHVTASTYVISSLNCFDEIHGKSQQWNFVLRHAACECIMSVTCWRKVAVHWLTLDCSCCRLHWFFNVNINSALWVTATVNSCSYFWLHSLAFTVWRCCFLNAWSQCSSTVTSCQA